MLRWCGVVHVLSHGLSLIISLVVGGIGFGVLLSYVVCVWVVLCKGCGLKVNGQFVF